MDETRPARHDNFGERFLKEDQDVYAFNAWDGVDFPKEKLNEIEEILERQRETAISDERREELIQAADQSWDTFYGRNSDKFFKDRKWLFREFPEIFNKSNVERKALEVGCGVGNTVYPMLEATEESNLFIYCCDFAPNAVNLVRNHEKFNANRVCPFVWDISRSDVDIPIQDGTLDYILCVFVLSAIPPEKQLDAIKNLVRLLKKDGIIYIRDYGRNDLTQLRFKKDRYIEENFYTRFDGTFTYFFDGFDLDEMLTNLGLQKLENFVDKRMVVNRKENKQMHRRWIQLKYSKI